MFLSSVRRFCGSSPRMWGKRLAGETEPLRRRFIPTHVGETFCFPSLMRCPSVHPHACGGNVFAKCHLNLPIGSFPRMWGKRISHPPFSDGWSVHPHACGGNSSFLTAILRSRGSSPRMWGKPVARSMQPTAHRFIPTHVGETVSIKFCCSAPAVHPHTCGGN